MPKQIVYDNNTRIALVRFSRSDSLGRTWLTMPPIFRSSALKVLGSVAVVALSFWFTLQALEHLSTWEQVRANVILTYGGTSASTIFLTREAKFQFAGDGYAELQDTKGLQCKTFKCKFSLAVTFASTQSDLQLIIGQSYYGESGWHLLWGGGRVMLQTDGGALQLAAPFALKAGQRYKLDIARDDEGVEISIDAVVVARSKVVPITDLARNVTIGGRAGGLPFAGEITDLQIARAKTPPLTSGR